MEFRHADGTRMSALVPNRVEQWPGSAITARSSGRPGPPAAAYAASASVSSVAIAPLPVHPSTKSTSRGSCRAVMWSRATVSIPRPRTIETE